MRLFIIAIDEPIYVNPYVEAIAKTKKHTIVGIACYKPKNRFTLKRLHASVKLAALVALIYSVKDLWRLFYCKVGQALKKETRTLKGVAKRNSVPYQEITDANAERFVKTLKKKKVDVVLNQTPQILKEVLAAPRKAVINRHMSYLPGYRGAFPVFWQFLRNEKEFGITIHTVDAGIDTGSVLAQRKIPRGKKDTMGSVYRKLFSIAPTLTLDALENIDKPKRKQIGTPSYFRNPGWSDMLAYLLRYRR